MKVIYFFRVGSDIEVCKRVKDDIEGWSNVIEVGTVPWPNTTPLLDAMAIVMHDRHTHHAVSCSFLIDGATMAAICAVNDSRSCPTPPR